MGVDTVTGHSDDVTDFVEKTQRAMHAEVERGNALAARVVELDARLEASARANASLREALFKLAEMAGKECEAARAELDAVQAHCSDVTAELHRRLDALRACTWWNLEPVQAKRVRVIVGTAPSSWWCAGLAGQERAAVRVDYDGSSLYLDDEDGSGWAKVTSGRGSPQVPHKSLVVEREVKP